jgi:ADP-ribose pyrophosphatase YjhB (NUDIX family)
LGEGIIVKQITRYGAYGVVSQGSRLLLTLKKSGPYKGLWGLPGGAIEFGEAPEDALKRELLEETALASSQLELLSIATSIGHYENNGEPYDFHHIGIIYKVSGTTLMPNFTPEEEGRWAEINNVDPNELTPFAKHILNKFYSDCISGSIAAQAHLRDRE